MTLQGFALVGPALHFWYGALAKVISQGGTTGKTPLSLTRPLVALLARWNGDQLNVLLQDCKNGELE